MGDPDPYAALGTVEPAPQAGSDPYGSMGTAVAPALHTYAAKKADGTVVQFQLPENAPDELVRHHAAQAVGDDRYLHAVVKRDGSPLPPSDHSAATGFLAGVMKPIDNASEWLHAIPGVGAVSDAISRATGLPTTDQAVQTNDATRANNDRTGYQTLGNIVGTLPTMEIPGAGAAGLLAQGGAAGALLSNRKGLGGIAADAGLGAAGGLAGGAALRALGGAIAPTVSPYVRTLLDNNVTPTFGQAMRTGGGLASRVMANLEDRANSLPIAGEAVNAGRQQAATQFRRGAVQQALTPIGIDLPDHLDTGHGMVHFAQRQISRAYNSALSRMQMVPDAQLGQDVADLSARVDNGALSPAYSTRLAQEVHGNVSRRIYGNGATGLNGQDLQTTLSSLRQKASRFGSSQDAEQQEYGDVLGELADHIENAATRSSDPAAVAARDAANTAYAHLVRVEGAAKNAIGGDFSPGQLDVAVRNGATSVRGRDASAGQALMQDYATAARRVLPSGTGSSGTAERLNTANPFKWLAGAALAPGAALSNRAVPFLTREASPGAMTAADLLRMMAPAGASLAAPLAVGAAQPAQ